MSTTSLTPSTAAAAAEAAVPITPTSLDRALTFIPLFSGTLTIVGALAILYNILSDPQRRCTTPYFRILLGIAMADIPFALSRMVSTFAAPRGTPGLHYASGTPGTCTAQRFLRTFGNDPSHVYTACLCIYYLLVIEYSKSEEYIAKYWEPYMHILSISYPLIGAIVSASMGLYKSNPHMCAYEIHPHSSSSTDYHYNRSSRYSSSKFVWIFIGGGLIVSFTIVAFCLATIVYTVSNRQHTMNRRFSFANHPIAQSSHLSKQIHAVKRQAYLYLISSIIIWGFSSVHRILLMIPAMERHQQQSSLSSSISSVLLILSQIFNPMQGFFHGIIYFWPRYIKSKEEYPDKTLGWLLYDAIITSTHEKIQRRQSVTLQKHYARRRKSMTEIKNNHRKLSPSGIESQGSHTVACELLDNRQEDSMTMEEIGMGNICSEIVLEEETSNHDNGSDSLEGAVDEI